MKGAEGAERERLAASLGLAVLGVLEAHGIDAAANGGAAGAGGTVTAGAELVARRARWMVTPATYLGAAGADPVAAVAALISPTRHPGGGGADRDPGPILSDGGPADPALIGASHEGDPERSNYGGDDVTPDEDVRCGYGG